MIPQLKLPSSFDDRAWNQFRRSLSDYQKIGEVLGEIEDALDHATEDDYERLKSLSDEVGDLIKLVAKANPKNKQWDEKTQEWLTDLDKDGKAYKSKVDKAQAEAVKRFKDQNKKYLEVRSKMPKDVRTGADLIKLVKVVEDGCNELDMSAFKNVREAGNNLDVALKGIEEMGELASATKTEKDLKKQQDGFNDLMKMKKGLKGPMEKLQVIVKKWETAADQLQAKHKANKGLTLVTKDLNYVVARFRFRIDSFFEQYDKIEKLEDLIEKQIEKKEEEKEKNEYEFTKEEDNKYGL